MRVLSILLFASTFIYAQNETIPPVNRLLAPTRIGVIGTVELGLPEVIQRVLAADRDLAVSRIFLEEANYNVKGAKGAFDPHLGFTGNRSRSVTPVSSILGGSADGKLGQEQFLADPFISGAFPALGGSYKFDLSTARQTSDSSFLTLNPIYPTTATLSLTQPLWRGLLYDDNRHRLEVAKKNVQLTDEQFRQRLIEVVTQAVQGYWELYYAYRNLDVQNEAVGLAQQQDASNRRQLEQGLLAPVDVAATQTQIATFQQTLFAAQQAVTAAENALKVLMLPDRTDLMWGMALVPSQEPGTEIAMPTLDDAIKGALAARPELAENALSRQVNQMDTKLSREQSRPQIDAVANVSISGLSGAPIVTGPNPLTSSFLPFINGINALNALNGLPPLTFSASSSSAPPMFLGDYPHTWGSLGTGNFTSATVGVNINVPLRNRTALAQLEVANAEGRRLRVQQQQVEMAVEQDVRNSLQATSSARARYDAAVLARENAERQYASEQRQFQAGTSTVFLVLQRQTDLIAARTREVRARADLGQAAAGLDHATARTIEAHNIQIH
jgi:outer membrane protein TolC